MRGCLPIAEKTVRLRRRLRPPSFILPGWVDTDLWRPIAKRCNTAASDQITCRIRTHCRNCIEAVDLRGIRDAADESVANLFCDDHDVNPPILGAGARKIHEFYDPALSTVPGADAVSREHIQKARLCFEPMVSIIIPVYNGENFLQYAIESALAQSYRNCEIVVVNDGSDDGGATERIALAYRERIRYVSKQNGGCASALNRAIGDSKGDYISWLSHDDLYTPDKIDQQIAFLAQQPDPSHCVVYGDYSVFSGRRPPSRLAPSVMPKVRPEDFRYFLTTQNNLHGCTLLIPRAAFDRHGLFCEDLHTVLDFDMWFRLARTERFVYRPGVVVQARAHPEQDTNRKREVHMREADVLLARFVGELSLDEVRSGSSCHPAKGYYVVAANLRHRNFPKAAARAVEIAEEMTRASIFRLRGDAGPESEASDAAETIETMISVASWLFQGSFSPSAAPYVAGGTRTTSLLGMGIEERALNSRFARDMARKVSTSPGLKTTLRRLTQMLPVSMQKHLLQIFRRIRD
jgi:glycosyltransferase involved in cell wall biosynthesis